MIIGKLLRLWAGPIAAGLLIAVCLSTSPARAAAEEGGTVVANVKELIAALRPGARIILEPGEYNLTGAVGLKSEHLVWEEVFDGVEPRLIGLDNLSLIGRSKEARVVIDPAYSFVLNFSDSKNVVIDNLTLGHTKPGYCTGGVLKFEDCRNVVISRSDLYGSGTYGLELNRTANLVLEDSVIHDCTYGIMQIFNSRNISFVDSVFRNNREFELITISDSQNILFSGCGVGYNQAGSFGSLFSLGKNCRNIFLVDSEIHGNQCSRFLSEHGGPGRNWPEVMTMIGVRFRDNSFEDYSDGALNNLAR